MVGGQGLSLSLSLCVRLGYLGLQFPLTEPQVQYVSFANFRGKRSIGGTVTISGNALGAVGKIIQLDSGQNNGGQHQSGINLPSNQIVQNVTIGGIPCTDIVWYNSTLITCSYPPASEVQLSANGTAPLIVTVEGLSSSPYPLRYL